MFRSLSLIVISLSMISETMSANAQSGYAQVNGIKMYYEIHGAGSPLVLIHGGGSTIRSNFSAILPILSKKHKVIAVELQAHGHTSDRDAPETFDQDADDVAALLKHLKIDKADILGFSNGGTTTMKIGMKYPSLVNKLVIISAMYKREGMFNGFFEMMEKATKEKPKMWGSSIIGFGNLRYKSAATGREVDWFEIGFSPRKANLSLYFICDVKVHASLLKELGKHKTGAGCLYINKLEDVDLKVLEEIIDTIVKAK